MDYTVVSASSGRLGDNYTVVNASGRMMGTVEHANGVYGVRNLYGEPVRVGSELYDSMREAVLNHG